MIYMLKASLQNNHYEVHRIRDQEKPKRVVKNENAQNTKLDIASGREHRKWSRSHGLRKYQRKLVPLHFIRLTHLLLCQSFGHIFQLQAFFSQFSRPHLAKMSSQNDCV